MGALPGERFGRQPVADRPRQARIEHHVGALPARPRLDGARPVIGPDLGTEILEIIGDRLARHPLGNGQIDDPPGQRRRRRCRHPPGRDAAAAQR